MSTCRQKDRKKPRGKNASKDHVSITARIPKPLKHRMKAAQEAQDHIDTNTLLERLITLWVNGFVDASQPAHDLIDSQQDHDLIDASQQEAAYKEAQRYLQEASQLDPIDSQQEASHWLDVLDLDPIDSQQEAAYKEAQARLLANARASLGMNQRDMAVFLGIAQKTVSNYERGLRVAPKHVITRCLAVCDPIDSQQEASQQEAAYKEAQARLL